MKASKGSAIVTGASSGIGAVYAERLAGRGHDLVLVARRRDRLESLAENLRTQYGCKAEVVSADLANEADLAKVGAIVENTADLELIANCAGLGALGLVAKIDPATLDSMVKVNVLALTHLSVAAARRFAAAKHGTIINIGSIIALMPIPGAGGYSGSKAYVLNFTHSLQAELADSNVMVQVVLPGAVRSEFFGNKPAPFSDQLFMTPETLVDTALTALDQGETVCFPTLHDTAAWQQFEGACSGLAKAVTQSGLPAERYKHASA
ncbi:MAG: SDR family NAD(P)-dependent oxidoreductase [Nostoc sp.]|uniref:SDR family NAD(P)-dependent oxidoreductase n=1 Tax=Nostoc sp. TaxID=1180 RepID=UPI002FFD2DF5